MKILVAEDESSCRRSLETVLKGWGFEVVLVDDGKQAHDCMVSDPSLNLVLLDWIMPKMDGLSVCRKVRQHLNTPLPYIVLLTAMAEKQDLVTGLEAGADDYIVKPYDPDELRARIAVGKRVVELYQALAEKDKLHGALEMAGAVCHEVNQPLMAMIGYAELLMEVMDPEDPNYEMVAQINAQGKRLGRITRKLMTITRYKTKPYLNTSIFDLDQGPEDDPGSCH